MAQTSKLVQNGKTLAKIGGIGPFGDAELSKSTNDAVYDDKNGKSTIAATFSLPLVLVGGSEVTITGRVYGRLQKDGSVGFDVSMPRGIVMTADTREAAKAHVSDAVIVWSGRKAAWVDAHGRLTAQPKPKGSKAAARADALVFKPEADEAADGPEADDTPEATASGPEAAQSGATA